MSEQDFAPIDDGLPLNDRRFRLLLDTLPFLAFVTAASGGAIYYNRPFIDYHGCVPGNDEASRISVLHPDDQSRVGSARRSAGAASYGESVIEARLRRHDGAYRWHRIHNKPLMEVDELVGWLGSAVDIHDGVDANEVLERGVRQRTAELERLNEQLTAEIRQRQRTEDGLRASEARYRLLYNRTPMALQSVDANARLIDVNDTWLEMFGYTRDAVIGRCPAEFMTLDSGERYRQKSWPEMLASRGHMRVVDYQFLTRSARMFDGRLAASGEFGADGRFVRSWAAIADVTAEKRADRDLRQAQRLEAVGQLTAGIAHDFNNLLTAILGNLELMSLQPTKGLPIDQTRIDRLVAGARSAAERGAKVTAQLLAFSRQQKIAAEPVALDQIIQGMAPLLRSTIGGSIGINIRSVPELPAALADPTQLELAILNLAINARDAMPNGGLITIEAAAVVCGEPVRAEEPMAGHYIAVHVADTGAGLSDTVRERMFEPFFTTKDVGKGSGLGLPQVLGVAKQLGGGLAVRSVLGEGTCVSIFLPRAGGVIAASVTQGQQAVILSADDDDADARLIAAAI